MREYVAVYEYNYHGRYTEEITFFSDHRANSKANYADAMAEIRRHKERGIRDSAVVLNTYLAV